VSTGPARSPVSIVPAHAGDLPAIMALERAGFAEPERWSERSWRGELLAGHRRILLARTYAPVGVISFGVIGELADLNRLVVAPAHRRQGVGSELVRAGLATVRAAGARAVILEVDYTNEPAIALYQRLGFEQLTVRDDYYGPGRSALILKRYDL
jgi:[ribosomal protein S18]-alanine N-acetyltransferase